MFCFAFEFTKPVLNYEHSFDSDIKLYLLEDYRYLFYELSVKLHNDQSYLEFIDFLENIKDLTRLKLKCIDWKLTDENYESYNKIYDILKKNTENQYEALQADYAKLPDKFVLKFHKCIPFDLEIRDRLSIFEFRESIINDPDKELRIKSISLDNRMFATIRDRRITLPEYIDGLETLILLEIKDRVSNQEIFNRIEAIKELNPRFKELNLNFSRITKRFFDFVTLEFKDLEIKSARAGYETNRMSKIYRNYEYIFFKNSISGVFKVIKVAKCTIGYKDKTCLMYSSDDILVFSKLSYIDMQEIVSVTDFGSKHDLFWSLYKDVKDELSDEMFWMISNKHIDYLSMGEIQTSLYPSLTLKSMDLNISYNEKDKFILMKSEFIKHISKNTKVNLNLWISPYLKECVQTLMLDTIEHLQISTANIIWMEHYKNKDFSILEKLLYKDTLNELKIDFCIAEHNVWLRNIKYNYTESHEKRAELVGWFERLIKNQDYEAVPTNYIDRIYVN